jgi:hypothetical protein
VDVATDAGVFRCDPGDGEELVREEHFRGHARAEFLYLAADVAKEGVAAPAADENYCEGGNTGLVHHHGRAQRNGVGADLICVKSQAVRTDATGGDSETGADLVAAEARSPLEVR